MGWVPALASLLPDNQCQVPASSPPIITPSLHGSLYLLNYEPNEPLSFSCILSSMLVTVTRKSNLHRDQMVMGNSAELRLCALAVFGGQTPPVLPHSILALTE